VLCWHHTLHICLTIELRCRHDGLVADHVHACPDLTWHAPAVLCCPQPTVVVGSWTVAYTAQLPTTNSQLAA